MPFREKRKRLEQERDTKQEKLKRESEEQRWIGKTSTEAETITSNAIKGRIWNRDRKGDGPIGHTAFSNAKIRRTNGRTDVSLETL